MASMVAKACNSTSSQMPAAMSVCDKGSRNKRKFRADPPMADPTKAIPLPANESTSFEFSAEKFDSHHQHTNGCDLCCVNQDTSDALKLDLGLGTSEVGVSHPREHTVASAYEFHKAKWSDFTETEMEELVLKNLDTTFKSAIKKIVASGYSEEIATKAILRSGIWYGCKDTLSNIVDNTLAFLRSGREIDPSMEHCFEDLQQMEKYILAELVCLLREVRPYFSTGDAMWHLLICDMNVSHACAMDGDPSGSSTLNENSSTSVQPPLALELTGSESNGVIPFKAKASVATNGQNYPSELPKLASTNDGLSFQSDAPNTNAPNPKPTFVPNRLIPDKDHQNSTTGVTEKTFSATAITRPTISEEKFVSSRKVSGITKREYVLRQKSMHLEKHNRAYGTKGATRASKLRSFNGLILDKKLKGVADSTGLNAKNSPFKIDNGFDAHTDNLSSTSRFTSMPTFGLDCSDHTSSMEKSSIPSTLHVVPDNASPSLPAADTELSLSYPSKNVVNPLPVSYNAETSNCSYFDSTSDSPLRQWASQEGKHEPIMAMVPQVREMQNQLQEWTEWANQRVMQAARRLSKDKAELKMLRQEKEEFEKLRKEKQTLEESTMKKIYEMENALRKAGRQIEQYNAAGARLEVENSALRREMEAAKLRAAESAASCQEVSKREKNTLIKFQSWEKQKTIFQEELSAEKLKLINMQQKLRQAKEILDQVEAKLNQEMKSKEELITQVTSVRKEREQIEASTQSKEAIMKSGAEANLHKYKENIAHLEKEISQLRLKTDSSKIAALRRGIDGGYTGGKVADSKNTPTLKEFSKMVTTVDLKDLAGNGGVKRERECVMCLTEEMSVVFLPCAHQVVCMTCNELHEKQGMKDCPSCRSPIQRRVSVRYAHS